MNNLFSKYQQEVLPKLKEEFTFVNDLQAPRVEKIVLNMGLAEVIANKAVFEKAKEQLAAIAAQNPHVTRAKKSISNFKLKKNDPIGLAVTLRGKRAWNFLEKFIKIIMPRMRDFRGLAKEKFDKDGNYSLGIGEQILFPEVDYSKIDKIRGLVVTVVIKNSTAEKSKRFLELLGAPFKKDG